MTFLLKPFLLKILKHKYLWGTLLIGGILTTLFIYKETHDRKMISLEEEIIKLQADLLIKQGQVNNLEVATNQIEQTLSLNIALRHELDSFKTELNDSVDSKLEIFKKHNLDNLASEKPKLIENRVNKATEQVFSQIEQETREFNEEML